MPDKSPANLPDKSPTKPPRKEPEILSQEIRLKPPTILNERELSFITGLCPRSIRNHVNDGLIPRIKIGRRVLFRWQQVEAALGKLEVRRTGPRHSVSKTPPQSEDQQ